MYKSYIGSAQVFHSTDKPRDAREVSMKLKNIGPLVFILCHIAVDPGSVCWATVLLPNTRLTDLWSYTFCFPTDRA